MQPDRSIFAPGQGSTAITPSSRRPTCADHRPPPGSARRRTAAGRRAWPGRRTATSCSTSLSVDAPSDGRCRTSEKPVSLHKPRPTSARQGFNIAQAIDGKPNASQGWAVSPATGSTHWAVVRDARSRSASRRHKTDVQLDHIPGDKYLAGPVPPFGDAGQAAGQLGLPEDFWRSSKTGRRIAASPAGGADEVLPRQSTPSCASAKTPWPRPSSRCRSIPKLKELREQLTWSASRCRPTAGSCSSATTSK